MVYSVACITTFGSPLLAPVVLYQYQYGYHVATSQISWPVACRLWLPCPHGKLCRVGWHSVSQLDPSRFLLRPRQPTCHPFATTRTLASLLAACMPFFFRLVAMIAPQQPQHATLPPHPGRWGPITSVRSVTAWLLITQLSSSQVLQFPLFTAAKSALPQLFRCNQGVTPPLRHPRMYIYAPHSYMPLGPVTPQ